MVAIRYALVLSLLIVLVPTVPLELSGQVPYAAEQAEAGEAIYQRSCSVCHLPNLQGSFEAPQLAGPNFRLNWGGRSMDDLWEVLGTMPPQATTSLTEEEYSALAAYLLRENGTGPGTTTLELNLLGSVVPRSACGRYGDAGARGGARSSHTRTPRERALTGRGESRTRDRRGDRRHRSGSDRDFQAGGSVHACLGRGPCQSTAW